MMEIFQVECIFELRKYFALTRATAKACTRRIVVTDGAGWNAQSTVAVHGPLPAPAPVTRNGSAMAELTERELLEIDKACRFPR